MDLSLLPSFAHYSLMSNSTSNYGHSYPSAHIDDYGSTFAQTASALYQHNHRSSLVPYPDPYLVQSSLLKESTPDHVSEGPTEHCSYYYLDNKLCHPEWPHLTPFDNTTSDGKLGPLALGATSLVPISTPPLTPRTPDCKSNFCSHPRPVPEEPLLEKSSAARSLIASKVINDDDNYITITSANGVVRVKRRSANKKERRRTQSINSAFSNLRDCIPNVPADTKLSKIKTLRLATSYISYLMELLEGPRENSCKLLSEGFRADLSNSKRSSQQNRLETQNEIQRHLRLQTDKQSTRRQSGGSSENRGRKSCDRSHSAPNISSKSDKNVEMEMSRELSEVESLSGVNFSQSTCGYPSQGTKPKCRTGWPQHVWALELKQYDQ